MSARQRGARAQANAAAARAGTAPAASEAVVTSKIDKTGLYDLQQVKRVLDDQIIAVRGHGMPPRADLPLSHPPS
jgi:hypothetical protein